MSYIQSLVDEIFCCNFSRKLRRMNAVKLKRSSAEVICSFQMLRKIFKIHEFACYVTFITSSRRLIRVPVLTLVIFAVINIMFCFTLDAVFSK